jgi:hypothetical protein
VGFQITFGDSKYNSLATSKNLSPKHKIENKIKNLQKKLMYDVSIKVFICYFSIMHQQ